MFCMLKKCILLMFQNVTGIMKKEVILLLIANRQKWHNLAVKKQSVLLRRKTWKKVILIVWNVFIPLEQKNLNGAKWYVKIKDFCNAVMPFEDTKILEFNQCQESDKAPFFIYADKIDRCKNNPENSSTTKLSEYISSGISMSII